MVFGVNEFKKVEQNNSINYNNNYYNNSIKYNDNNNTMTKITMAMIK